MEKIKSSLDQLLALEDNWDGEGEKALSSNTTDNAWRLYENFSQCPGWDQIVYETMSLSGHGGIGFNFKTADTECYLILPEDLSDGIFYYADHPNNPGWNPMQDGEIHLNNHNEFQELVDWMVKKEV